MTATSAPVTTADEVIGKFPCVRVLGHVPGGVTCIVRGDDGLLVAERLHRKGTPPEEVELFLERARAVAPIKHAGIPRVKVVVETPELVAVTTEVIEGEWLDELKLSSFPLACRLRIVVDVLAAVNALHSDPSTLPVVAAQAHVVHGEITPAHILVGVDGTTRLTRAVRAYPARSRPELASAWSRWAAPEQLLNDAASDGRVDIYAIGALLWEAIAERALFENEDAPSVLARQVAGDLPKPRVPATAPWCAPLSEVAMKALQLDPFNRYASAAELAGAIRLVAKNRLAAPADVAKRVMELAGQRISARRNAASEVRPAMARPRVERTTAPDTRGLERPERSGIVARPVDDVGPATTRGRAAEDEIGLGDEMEITLEAETSPALAAPMIPFAPSTEPDVLAHMPKTAPPARAPSKAPPVPSKPPPLPPGASKAPRVPGKSVAPPLPPRASVKPPVPISRAASPPVPVIATAAASTPKTPTAASMAPRPGAPKPAPVAASKPAVPPPALPDTTEPMAVVTDDEGEGDSATMVTAPPVHITSATPTEVEAAVVPKPDLATKPMPVLTTTPSKAPVKMTATAPAATPFALAPSAMPPPMTPKKDGGDVVPSVVPPPPPEILALADMPLPPAPARVEADASQRTTTLDEQAAARFAAIAQATPSDAAPTKPLLDSVTNEVGDEVLFGNPEVAALRRKRTVFGVMGVSTALLFVALFRVAFCGQSEEVTVDMASATTASATTRAPDPPPSAATPTKNEEPVVSAAPPPPPPPPADEPKPTIVAREPDPPPPPPPPAPVAPAAPVAAAPVTHVAPSPAPHPTTAPAPAPTVKKKPPHSKYEPSGI